MVVGVVPGGTGLDVVGSLGRLRYQKGTTHQPPFFPFVSTRSFLVTLVSENTGRVASPRSRVVEWVHRAIAAGELRNGGALPSERALASSLDVSRNTVRAALDDLVDAKVLLPPDRSRLRRVRPAPDSRGRSLPWCDAVGLLSNAPLPDPNHPGLDTMEAAYIKACLAHEVEEHRYPLLTLQSSQILGSAGLDKPPSGLMGLLIVEEAEEDRALVALLKRWREELPIVVRSYDPAFAGFDRVLSDHAGGSYELTRWLLGRGRKRILRLWTVPRAHAWLDLRNRGHEKAMEEAGLPILPPVVPGVPIPRIRPHVDRDRFNDGARIMAGFLAEYVTGDDPIDAIMLPSDGHAHQAAAALRMLHLRPNEDVVLVGYDNNTGRIPERVYEPVGPAATIEKFNENVASEMIGLLKERFERGGQEEARLVYRPHRLVTP